MKALLLPLLAANLALQPGEAWVGPGAELGEQALGVGG